jgi:aminoglycoside phosphotransferase (APT) family kinase protein
MLLPDPRLHSLRTAWSPEEMLRLINAEALPQLRPGAVATELTISSITYRPARTCAMLYAMRLAGGEAPVRLLATFGKPGRAERAYRKHCEGPEESPARAVLLAEHNCLIELFPADSELPSLPAALDSPTTAAALSMTQPDIEVLHYVPHRRCLIAYSYDGIDVVGKLYPADGSAARAWGLLQRLNAAQGDAVCRVTPRPVAFVEQHGMVVMERVGGTPLHELLDGASAIKAAEAVARAGAVLASLHVLDVDVAMERSIAQELAHVRKRNERVRIVEPALAGALDDVLDRVEPLVRAARAETSGFVHGDYKASQLLIDGERVVAVDFDRAAHGDPALDAGNFLADLHRQAVLTRRDGLRDLGTAFLDAYAAHASVPGLAQRARLGQVVVLARMVARAFRHAPHDYAESPSASLATRLLREATACLEAL